MLNEAKARFYSNITHEFRTPLTVILGLVNSIRGNAVEKELIKKSGVQLLDLVQQLLDISKAQSGMLELKMTEENIIPYLEYLLESFYSLADQKQIKLEFETYQEEVHMLFDREKIRFILNNLVSNAIKYTPPGGRVLLIANARSDRFELVVTDTGIGLSKKETRRIFDRFYRAASPETPADQGDGIGLALVREVIALCEGDIEVSSKPGEGTSFFISLPKDKNFEEFRKENVAMEKPANSFVSSENESIVLVAEDNDDVLFYIERILSPRFKVLKARDGKEALEMAIDIIPDIIISDVMMPRMDGYRLTEQLKEDDRTNHIPIILLTAKAGQAEKIRGLEGGADAYLTKPFHEEELFVRIDQMIRTRRRLWEAFASRATTELSAPPQDPFLRRALEVLEQQYANEVFGVREFGEALHLSRMQVHRKLKALTNFSTSQFINDFRLQKGRALLVEEQLTVSEVSYSCGFRDPGYFSKLFTRKYGQSPNSILKKNNQS